MYMIFQILGTPNDEEMEFVTDKKARQYIKSFPKMKKVNLQDILHGSGAEGIDLLTKMLVFNPANRITVSNALKH